MRAGLRSSLLFPTLWVGCALACSNAPGISDPNLNEGGQASGGSVAAHAGSDDAAGMPQSTGGEPALGVGGDVTGGAAGSPPVGCGMASCNDDIDCTLDACVDGECVHTPDSSMCDRDANECIVCKVGFGCVPGTTLAEQLLINPTFDEPIGAEWEEQVQDALQTFILYQDDYAHSAPNAARYLGVQDVETATAPAHVALFQPTTIPANAVGLKLTGMYQLLPGSHQPADDYVVAGIYQGTTQLVELNDWRGDDVEAYPWTPFEGSATTAELTGVVGRDVTFSITGETWDSSFYFDTLSLEATLCEDEEE